MTVNYFYKLEFVILKSFMLVNKFISISNCYSRNNVDATLHPQKKKTPCVSEIGSQCTAPLVKRASRCMIGNIASCEPYHNIDRTESFIYKKKHRASNNMMTFNVEKIYLL